MLQWFLRFYQFTEFIESSALFRENSIAKGLKLFLFWLDLTEYVVGNENDLTVKLFHIESQCLNWIKDLNGAKRTETWAQMKHYMDHSPVFLEALY